MRGMDPAEQERIEEKIRAGMELQDFIASYCGKYLLEMLNLKISLMCADAMLKKHNKGDNKGEFVYSSFPDIERCRGFVLGVQWVLDEISSIINTAVRLEQDRKKLDKQE